MSRSKLLLSLAGCLAGACWLTPAVAQGEVYKWVDETGQVHYSEKKDVAGSQAQALKISTALPAAAAAGASAPASAPEAFIAPVMARTAAAKSSSLGDLSLIYRAAPKPRGVIASAR